MCELLGDELIEGVGVDCQVTLGRELSCIMYSIEYILDKGSNVEGGLF